MNVQPQILCYRTVFIRAIMFDICIQPNIIIYNQVTLKYGK